MKKLFYILFLLPLLVTAQSQDQNYVKTKVYTKPTTTDVLTVDDTLITIQYSDGLGRPIQSIAIKAGGKKQDIITPVVYDSVSGKQVRSYLPYAYPSQNISSQNYRPNDMLVGNLESYYQVLKHPDDFSSDTRDTPNPYSETFYEASPLNRVLKQAAPGEAWKGNINDDNDRTIRFSYNTNALYEVPDFTVTFPTGNTEATELAVNGYYEPWTLIKNTTKDENWTAADGNNKTTQEFTDLNGKTLLKRTFNNNEPHDTYYVYDKYDNLTYVIPPLAADQIIIGDEPQVYAGRNYPWTDMAQVDAKLADAYGKDLLMYDNSDILNVDLLDQYGGQGGFSVLPSNDGGIVLNLNMTFDQPIPLKRGEVIADLTEFGQFPNKELGRLQGPEYDYIFYIDKNAIYVDGGGVLPSINVSLMGDSKLEYSKNIPWTSLCDVSTEVKDKYEKDIETLDNSEILSVYTPNDYGATGGIAVSVDADNALSLSISIATDPTKPLSLQQGMAFPLGITRRLTDRPLGVIQGNGYLYKVELRDNYIYFNGSGTVTNVNFTGTFNEEQPNLTINNNAKEGLCYIYHYDYRNRVVEKKIPGKGWEYMVYDKLNRLVMAQDQNLYSDSKWMFTKYDKFNRPVYTGQVTDTHSRVQIQTTINAAVVLNESRTTTSFSDGGKDIWYTGTTYPQRAANNTNNFTVLTINYYDDYEYDSVSQGSLLPGTVYSQSVTGNTKALPTGSYTRVLDTDDWIFSLNAYDDKARVIYGYTSDSYLDYTQTVKMNLDFTGAVTESETSHNKKVVTNVGGASSTFWKSTIIQDYYTYDHMHRLLSHTQKEKNKAHEEMIVYNKYDELGQLVQKKVGDVKGASYVATTGLQTIDYTFNVRGWLKGINDVGDDLSASNDLFTFGINYNTADLAGTTTLYNGNIAETHWKTKTDNKIRSYAYDYDALNRLQNANYVTPYAYGLEANPTVAEGYNEGNIKYDKNGNIERLERYGLKGTDQIDLIDDLVYEYEEYSNKLVSVTDNGYTDGFTDGNIGTDDYQYDANGNMTLDRNKGIANISYNYLNLPTRITVNSNRYIDYVYDAVGTKLKKIVTDSLNVTTTEYNGGFVYQKLNDGDNNLQFFPTEEGYVTKDSSNNFSYIYQYKDHLGNVRLSYTDADKNHSVSTSEIIEENNYYAYGMKHRGYNTLYNVQDGNSAAQDWKYNGIEYEDALGINIYEMDARQYDPAIARWTVIDPVIHHSMSPYNAFDNNPVYWADPSGADAHDDILNSFYSANSGITNYNKTGWGFKKTGYASDQELADMGVIPHASLSGGGGGGGGGGGKPNFFGRLWRSIFGSKKIMTATAEQMAPALLGEDIVSVTQTSQVGKKYQADSMLGDSVKLKTYTSTTIGDKNTLNIDVTTFMGKYEGTSYELNTLIGNLSYRDRDGRVRLMIPIENDSNHSFGLSFSTKEGYFGMHMSSKGIGNQKTGWDFQFRPGGFTALTVAAALAPEIVVATPVLSPAIYVGRIILAL